MKPPTNRRPFWAADCETDPFDGITIPRPFIWGVYNGYSGEYHEFGEPGLDWSRLSKEEIDRVSRRITNRFMAFVTKNDVILYAHNGGKFDWHFITHKLEPKSIVLFIAGRMAKFRIGGCEFRDSYNLMPISLDQYQKQKFDYDLLHRSIRHKYEPEISTYLKSDCVNLWNMLRDFQLQYGLPLTQASGAMRMWQRKFSPGLRFERTKAFFYDHHKRYYYGGRVQCFKTGDLKIKAIGADINSAYPYAMMHLHPISKKNRIGYGMPEVKRWNWGPMLFDVRCVARGCFPYRDSRKATYYPSDDVTRTYHVTGWELMAALDTETIEPDWKIIKYIEFEKVTDFKLYMNYFWDKRKEFKEAGDDGGSLFCKLFMNSLYGKFAADPRKYKTHHLILPDQLQAYLDDATIPDFFCFREWIVTREKLKEKDRKFYNVATAASITGFVRAMLWRAICASKNPLYCDTDSVTAEAFPKGSVELGPELGQWEIEGRYDRVILGGKKLYSFRHADNSTKDKGEWKTRSKGVKLEHTDLIKIAEGQEVLYNPEAPTFSMHGTAPTFTRRMVRSTAKDITTVPREFDPEFRDVDHTSEETDDG